MLLLVELTIIPNRQVYYHGQADDVFRQHGLEQNIKLSSDALGGAVYYHDYGSEGKRTLTKC